jgi:hypothetical protein
LALHVSILGLPNFNQPEPWHLILVVYVFSRHLVSREHHLSTIPKSIILIHRLHSQSSSFRVVTSLPGSMKQGIPEGAHVHHFTIASVWFIQASPIRDSYSLG